MRIIWPMDKLLLDAADFIHRNLLEIFERHFIGRSQLQGSDPVLQQPKYIKESLFFQHWGCNIILVDIKRISFFFFFPFGKKLVSVVSTTGGISTFLFFFRSSLSITWMNISFFFFQGMLDGPFYYVSSSRLQHLKMCCISNCTHTQQQL